MCSWIAACGTSALRPGESIPGWRWRTSKPCTAATPVPSWPRARREVGVRMALGARPEQIRRQFLGLALRLLVAGTILGMTGACIAGQTMRALLFHVPAYRPAILTASAAVIAAISLFRLPAARASGCPHVPCSGSRRSVVTRCPRSRDFPNHLPFLKLTPDIFRRIRIQI